jgi:hypothetical protein
MSREDEILDTLKKILALQQESLDMSKEYRRTAEAQAEATRAKLADAQSRQAKIAKLVVFAKYLNIVMAVIVLLLIGYVIHRVESLPPPAARTSR